MNTSFSIEKKPIQSGLIIAVSGLVGSFLSIVVGLSLGVNTSSLFFIIATLTGVMAVIFGLTVLCVGFVSSSTIEFGVWIKKVFRKTPQHEKWKHLFTDATDKHIGKVAEVEIQNYNIDGRIEDAIDGYDFRYKIEDSISDYDFSYDIDRYLDQHDFSEYLPDNNEEIIERMEKLEVDLNTVRHSHEELKESFVGYDHLQKSYETAIMDIAVDFNKLEDEFKSLASDRQDKIDNPIPSLHLKEVLSEVVEGEDQSELESFNFAKEKVRQRGRAKYNRKKMNASTNRLSMKALSKQYFKKDGSPRFEEDGVMIFDGQDIIEIMEDQKKIETKFGLFDYQDWIYELTISEFLLVFSSYGMRNQNAKHLGRLVKQLKNANVNKVSDLVVRGYTYKVEQFEDVEHTEDGFKSGTFLALYTDSLTGKSQVETSWIKQRIKNVLNTDIFGDNGNNLVIGSMAHFYLMEAFETLNEINKELGVKRV